MAEHNNTPSDLAKRGMLAALGLVAAAGAAVIGNRKANAQTITSGSIPTINIGIGDKNYSISAQTILPNGTIKLFPIGPTGNLNGIVQVSLNVTINSSAGTISGSFAVAGNPATQTPFNISGAVETTYFQGVSLIVPVSVVSGNIVVSVTGNTGFTVTGGTVFLSGSNS